MRDSTILMLLTTLLILGFRFLKRNGLVETNSYKDVFLSEVYSPTPSKTEILRPDQMLAKSNQLIENYPSDAGAYCDRGAAYIRLEQYDDAINDLNRAIELQPVYADALNNRGVAYYRLAQFEQAINDFTTAISNVSDDETYYLNRSMGYKKLGNAVKAGVDIDHVLELKPRLLNSTHEINSSQKMILEKITYPYEMARIFLFKGELLTVKYERRNYSDDAALDLT